MIALIIGARLKRGADSEDSTGDEGIDEHHFDNFKRGLSNAVSDAVFSDHIDKCFSSIATNVRTAFGGDAFVFRRKYDSIELVAHSTGDAARLAEMLTRYGLNLDVHAIPLSDEREKIFTSPYTEMEDAFQIVGDMVTTAACRRIQRELKFKWILTAATKTDKDEFAIIALISEKNPDTRTEFLQFSDILKSAIYISALKRKLAIGETTTPEGTAARTAEVGGQIGRDLLAVDELQLPAALLDTTGAIVESNAALRELAGKDSASRGGSFPALVDEAGGQRLEEIIGGKEHHASIPVPAIVSARHFDVYISEKNVPTGDRSGWVVVMAENKFDADKRRELEHTIDSLKTEVGLAQRLAADATTATEEIIRNAPEPMIAVSGSTVEFANEKCSQTFEVTTGQAFDDFLSENGVAGFRGTEATFETIDARGRSFFVTQWNTTKHRFCTFTEISDQKRVQEDLRKSELERAKLFNSLLPTAIVKDDKLFDWNNAFGSLFKDFLFKSQGIESGNTIDAFLTHIGETPDEFKLELRSSGFVMRSGLSGQLRKTFDLSAVSVGDQSFLFVRDTSDTEAARLELTEARENLSGLLISLRDEPVIIVRNGVVTFANSAAVDHLPINPGQQFLPSDVSRNLGIKDFGESFLLMGKTYRVEILDHGSLVVYRFRAVAEEVKVPAELPKKDPLHKIFRQLVLSEGYDSLLRSLQDLLATPSHNHSFGLLAVGTVQEKRGTSEVHYVKPLSRETEYAESLAFVSGDANVLRDNVSLSRDKIPDTEFMKLISADGETLLIQTVHSGVLTGFASVSVSDGGASQKDREEIEEFLKIASSVAVNISFHLSAERKFAEAWRTTRAVVGLAGIETGAFTEVLKRTIDLLKQVLGCDSTAAYMMHESLLEAMSIKGDLPSAISPHRIKFGSFVPAADLDPDHVKLVNGLYFALRSKSGELVLLFKFVEAPPASSELGAIASIALDLLESRMHAENKAKLAFRSTDELNTINEFLKRLAASHSIDEVARILEESLLHFDSEATVNLKPVENGQHHRASTDLVEKVTDGRFVCEADLSSTGGGVLTVNCLGSELARTMVSIGVDKIRSLYFIESHQVRVAPSGSPVRALLVESDGALVDEESANLMREVAYLKVTGDASNVARMLESEVFDIAFISLEMPSINGRELCSHLKKVLPNCITVLLANHEGEEISDGIDSIVVRPLDETKIGKLVSK